MSGKSSVLYVSRFAPNSSYFQVCLGVEPIGTLEQTSKGFIAGGGRKVLKTMEEAAREVARRRCKQSLAAAARFSAAALESPVSVDAVDPSATDPGTPTPRV